MPSFDNHLIINEGTSNDFSPRSYQQELFDHALKRNSILVSGTGSGKTFIAIMLIKELGAEIRGKISHGAKRTIFVVNTVPLVYQQAEAIARHTPFKVARYEGSLDVDHWTSKKWQQEIDNNEVLVMVAEICKSIILHKRISLENINLLIVDECHHATGNHPMREIMNEYRRVKESEPNKCRPRILGLTACVINKKCLTKEVEVLMKELEISMDCALITSKYQEMVACHSTKSEEIIEEYKVSDVPISEIFLTVQPIFAALEKEVKTLINLIYARDDKRKRKIKFFKKIISNVINSTKEIGDFAFEVSIKQEVKILYKMATISRYNQDLYSRFAASLLQVIHQTLNLEKLYSGNYISAKVKKLFEILTKYTAEDDDLRVIVFVEKRNTARCLHYLLLRLKKNLNLDYLNPLSIVGRTGSKKWDLKFNGKIENQKKVISKFRKGICNIIFATSVLEEGIDVQKCNLVIRFDKPKCFSSYCQSLGRARAASSKFIFLTSDRPSTFREIQEFKEVSRKFIQLCRDRPLPSCERIARPTTEDTGEEPAYAPFGILGPKITFQYSTSVVNKYLGTLPKDEFTKLSVTVEEQFEKTGVRASLTLPRNAPLRGPIWGKVKQNRKNAKQSAALELCVRLHEIGELTDEHLLPRILKNDFRYKNLPLGYEVSEVDEPEKRHSYARQICKNFNYSKSLSSMYLHYLHFEKNSGFSAHKQKLGFLSAQPINCCKFDVECLNIGKIEVDVRGLCDLAVQDEIVGKIAHFHMLVYQFILKLTDMVFNPKASHHAIFLVPLTSELKIDSLILEYFSEFNSFAELSLLRSQNSFSKMEWKSQEYEDAVIIPTYRGPLELYMVEKVLFGLNPLSPFPNNNNCEFSSYKDYYKYKYNIEIKSNEQPLLRCRRFPDEFNSLKIIEISKPFTLASNLPIFIPELISILPFTASFWWQVTLVPLILHRINGLMLERELFKDIKFDSWSHEDPNFIHKKLDYRWCEAEVAKCDTQESNLVAALSKKTTMSIYPGMILQALTSTNVRDKFNLERLEVFGDSFLKYATSVQLFLKEVNYHEGQLTIERSLLVANKTLYNLAKLKKIPELYQGFVLNNDSIVPYGFQKRTPHSTKDKYEWHLRKGQTIRNKSIADCTEALAAVYLLSGGEVAAKHFLVWLGFYFLNHTYSLPETYVIRDHATPEQITNLYKRCCLDELEKTIRYKFRNKKFLIAAVTHPSDTRNMITDCYQSLEFLGDAILDYLITGHIFAKFNIYAPGKLHDLRSYLVNNETLGRAAVRLDLHKYLQHGSQDLERSIDTYVELLNEDASEVNTEIGTEEDENMEMPKALGDIVEAILAAVYIDSQQSLSTCWAVVKIVLEKELQRIESEIPINHVRELHEKSVATDIKEIPATENCPAKCIIKMRGYGPITGYGTNRKAAKQNAARKAILTLKRTKTITEQHHQL